LFAPAKTPQAVVDAIGAAVAPILRAPAVRAELAAQGIESTGDLQPKFARQPALATNNERIAHRPRLPKTIGERFARRGDYELAQAMENAGLPFAPNRRPQDLYDDEHLRATGGIADMRLSDGPRAGETVETVLFPITLEGQRLGIRLSPPRLGEHTTELLGQLGFGPDEMEGMRSRNVVA